MGGIIQANCYMRNLNHAVTAVGFDNSHSVPYWRIQNSWGTSWGENATGTARGGGFFRIQKDVKCIGLDRHNYSVETTLISDGNQDDTTRTTTSRTTTTTTTRNTTGEFIVKDEGETCSNGEVPVSLSECKQFVSEMKA